MEGRLKGHGFESTPAVRGKQLNTFGLSEILFGFITSLHLPSKIYRNQVNDNFFGLFSLFTC